MSIELLVGKTLASIENSGDELRIVCSDGDAFLVYHMQDCCEDVRIHDIIGSLADIIGSPVTLATENASSDWPDDVPPQEWIESFTWTIHTIATQSGSVTIRWLGTSNGYYGESVYVQRTHTPMTLPVDWNWVRSHLVFE